MQLGLLRRIMVFLSVALFALGGAFSAAGAPAHLHGSVGTALAVHHDHAGHPDHGGGAAFDDHSIATGQPSLDDEGSCDHPEHACCHVHACCLTALAVSDAGQPEPSRIGERMLRPVQVLPAGAISHPLLRPPRAAA